jgi:hypothetical protein
MAQQAKITEPEITIHKMRLPFPASKDKKSKYYSLDDEVAIILTQAVRKLKLYDIIVGIYIDSTLENQDSTITDEMIMDFEDIKGFTEAIVLIATNISQQGVPRDEDEAYFQLDTLNWDEKSKRSKDEHSKNIKTQLLVFAQIIDIETGESLGTLDLEVFHTGGSPKKSKAKAIKLLKRKVIYELKSIYWFSADILTTKNGMTGLPFGTSFGIKKGMMFELIEPDRIWTFDDEEILVPGGSAAIAAVVDTSADSSGLRILRQWRVRYPGGWAVEYPASIFALGLNFIPPSTESYTNLGIYLHVGAIHDFDWGFGMHIIRVTDSFGDDDFGFGLGGFGIYRFLNTSKIDLGGKLGVDLDIPYRKDDDGQTVNTVLFSAYMGVVGEFLLSKKIDFVISAGYRFSTKSDKWEYSEDEETFPAYWEKDAPEVDNSGFMLSVGFKYLLF